MKILLFFISINLLSINCQSQSTPCGESINDWHLEKGNTFMTIIFTDSAERDSATIYNTLLSQIKTLGGTSNVRANSGVIDFDVSGYKSNRELIKEFYPKATLMIYLSRFNASAYVKNGRYKLVVSNVNTSIPGAYGSTSNFNWNEQGFNNKGCLHWLNVNQYTASLNCLHDDLLNKFKLKSGQDLNDW